MKFEFFKYVDCYAFHINIPNGNRRIYTTIPNLTCLLLQFKYSPGLTTFISDQIKDEINTASIDNDTKKK